MTQPNLFLANIATKELVAELKRREDEDPLFLDKLKKGIECWGCGRERKRYPYSLNTYLATLAEKIFIYCRDKNTNQFTAQQVFGNEVRAYKQYHKLKIFGVLKKLKSEALWELTDRGSDWIQGEIELPERVWMFDNTIMEQEDRLVSIGDVEPEWKTFRSEFLMDYIVEPHHITQPYAT